MTALETLALNLKILWALAWACSQPWEMQIENMHSPYSWAETAFGTWAYGCADFDYWIQIGNLAIHDTPSPCDRSKLHL